MKRKLIFLIPVLLCSFFTSALAADVKVKMSIHDALANSKVQEVVNTDISLYWGDQKHPAVEKEFGEFKTSQRTNAFRKSRDGACQWALAAALKVMQQRASREGGNAIINLQSNIKSNVFSSDSEFECLVGSMMVNVAVKGIVVKLAK